VKFKKITLKGPTSNEAGAEYLNNLVEMEVSVLGNPKPDLIANATLGDYGTYSAQIIYNPINWEVTQTDMLFHVIQQPFGDGYTASSYFGGVMSCPSSSNLGALVNLDTPVVLPPYSYSTILMQPSYDPQVNFCALYLPLVTCSGLIFGQFTSPYGNNMFLVNTFGTFKVSIGEFTFTQKFKQDNVPLYCVGSIENFWNNFVEEQLFTDYCQLTVEGQFCYQPYFGTNNTHPFGGCLDQTFGMSYVISPPPICSPLNMTTHQIFQNLTQPSPSSTPSSSLIP